MSHGPSEKEIVYSALEEVMYKVVDDVFTSS